MHQSPVFSGERNHIGDGAYGYQIKQLRQLLIERRVGEAAGQGLSQPKSHAYSRERLIGGDIIGTLRIQQRQRFSRSPMQWVVISDDDLHSQAIGQLNLAGIGGSAVGSNQKSDSLAGQQLNRQGVQPTSIILSRWNK
jgi:hypothetical protein